MRIVGVEQYDIRPGDKRIYLMVETDEGGSVGVEVDFDDVDPAAARLVARTLLEHLRGHA